MAVNLYVGSLVRFHTEKWQSVYIRSKSKTDGNGAHSSPFEDEKVSPIELRNYIIEWRKQISHALKKHLNAPLNWTETPDAPSVTEAVDERAYDALLLWAAYAASPDLTKPNELHDDYDFDTDPAILALENLEEFDYSQILSDVIIWLPFNLDIVFDAEFLNYEEPISVGSSGALFEQLKKLNQATWQVPVGEITSWREAKIDENNLTLETLAKHGFAVFYNMAQQSVMQKQPMALYH